MRSTREEIKRKLLPPYVGSRIPFFETVSLLSHIASPISLTRSDPHRCGRCAAAATVRIALLQLSFCADIQTHCQLIRPSNLILGLWLGRVDPLLPKGKGLQESPVFFKDYTQLNSTDHLKVATRGKKLIAYIYPRFLNIQSIWALKVLTVLE